jgi:ribulose-5-phosphate 4-epimerase/fuculose-1-phosphate aldolase
MSTVLKRKAPALRERVSEAEWRTRVDLAAAYRLTHKYGMATTLIYNHISARVPGEEHHILLNPFGLRYDEVTASNLVKIDLDGNVLDGSSYEINRAGYVIHSAIHRARADVAAVMHTHTEPGMAVSALEDGLLFVNQDSIMFYGNVGYHPFEGIADDMGECERLVSDLGDNLALVLQNHGLLTVGRTVGEAFVLMFFLEKVCKAQLQLMAAAHGRIRQPSRQALEYASRQFDLRNKPCGGREWPALVRELDAADQSYKE